MGVCGRTGLESHGHPVLDTCFHQISAGLLSCAVFYTLLMKPLNPVSSFSYIKINK